MKKMMDIVPQRPALEEQPKSEKREKKRVGDGLKQGRQRRKEAKQRRTAAKRARKSERKQRKIDEGRTKKEARRERKERRQQRVRAASPLSRVAFVLGGLIIIAASVFVILSLKSKLSLTLYFAQELITVQDEVEVDVEGTEINVEDKVIPGKFFEIEKEKWEVFAATGRVEEDHRAEGVIKVYNSHNPPRPVALVEKTRFLSSGGGKIFRALERIYLPAASIKGGKVVSSVTEIRVGAAEPGPDYNIEPSKFSVPGLAGTALYYTIWAESEEPMRGGEEGEVAKVTEDDLKDAKAELARLVKNSAITSLERELPSGFVLDEGAVVEEDIETTCFKTAETITPDFNCYGKIKLKGLAFKLEDLKSIALGFIEEVKPSSKELRPGSLEVSFALKGAAAKAGKMVLSVSAEAEAYEQLNQDLLFYQVYGKKAEHIRRVILDNFPQIEKVYLRFWPFWVKRAPKNIERIDINLTPLQP